MGSTLFSSKSKEVVQGPKPVKSILSRFLFLLVLRNSFSKLNWDLVELGLLEVHVFDDLLVVLALPRRRPARCLRFRASAEASAPLGVIASGGGSVAGSRRKTRRSVKIGRLLDAHLPLADQLQDRQEHADAVDDRAAGLEKLVKRSDFSIWRLDDFDGHLLDGRVVVHDFAGLRVAEVLDDLAEGADKVPFSMP